jgi:hypothetical protein
MNQEDLLNTKTLPLLLNARGRHPPSHFAAADIEAMHLGKVSKAIAPVFLNQYIMMLNGMTENTRDYGRLVGWHEHPDAFDQTETISSRRWFVDPGGTGAASKCSRSMLPAASS